jgi:hypothetical protein
VKVFCLLFVLVEEMLVGLLVATRRHNEMASMHIYRIPSSDLFRGLWAVVSFHSSQLVSQLMCSRCHRVTILWRIFGTKKPKNNFLFELQLVM